MPRPQCFSVTIIAVVFLACKPLGAAAPATPAATSAAKERQQLAAVLASDRPDAEKLFACKRLALIGNADSVPALASLLSDAELSHAARLGLEAIPDPAADEALRGGLTQVKGDLLGGVLNSIGARRDRRAVAGLGRLLGDKAPAIASAAAAALGKIAGPEAAHLLTEALATTAPAVRPAIARASLACAQTLEREGDRARALALYDHLRQANLPAPLLTAATRGAILARREEGIALLVAELGAEEDARFAAALGTSRELSAPGVTEALAGRLTGLPPARQALLIAVLGDRGDAAARPGVLRAAASSAPAVRIAAIRALSTLGNASHLTLLLDAAAQSDAEVAAAARTTLVELADPQVDAAVAEMLGTAAGTTQRILVELAGRRQITAAVPALLKATRSPDEGTRLAAIAALGRTGGPRQLPMLTGRLVAPTDDRELAVVQDALQAACRRSTDKEACAEALVRCLPQTPRQTRLFLFELLGSLGGSRALEAVSAAAADGDEATQDVATRVLGQWLSPDAAPALLKIARISQQAKFRIRALRGAIRILRQMDVPPDSRLALCREAMELADRDEERILVLEALGRVPSRQALAVVVSYLDTASLTAAAGSAAVAIGEKLVLAEPAAVATAMQKVLQKSTQDDLVRRARELLIQAQAKPPGT